VVSYLPSLNWRGSWLEQATERRLRLSMLAVVLLLSALVGANASLATLGVLLGASAVVVCVRWPVLGLAAVIAASQVVPFHISTGTQTDLHAGVLLLGLLIGRWVLELLVHRERNLVASPAIWPALALAGVATLAFMVGQHPWLALARPAPLAAQLGGLGIFLLSIGALLLVGYTVRSVRSLQFLTWVFLALGAVFVAGEIARDLGATNPHLAEPGAAGSLFWIWLAALASSQALFNRRLHVWWRVALGGLVLASLYHNISYAPDWLSGYVPPLVALLAILGSRAPRLALFGAMAAAAAALFARAVIGDPLQSGGNGLFFSLVPASAVGWRDLVSAHVDADSNTRLEFWRTVGRIIQLDPLLGLGPANYAWYAVIFPTSQAAWGYLKISSHNNYVDLVAQTGVLGLGCFLWFVMAIGRLGWWLRTRVPTGFAQAYAYGALGGLAGSVVAAGLGDWVLPFVYNIGYAGFRASVLGWLFLGGLVALEKIFAAHEVPAPTPSALISGMPFSPATPQPS
jgi:hypothetical protein